MINSNKDELMGSIDWNKVPNSKGNCEIIKLSSEKNMESNFCKLENIKK